MTKGKAPPIWQLPALIASGLGLLGLLGTWAVGYTSYAELPKKVEKVEAKNETQDSAIDKLTALQEFYANQSPNQQMLVRKKPKQIIEEDPSGTLWCCDEKTAREGWENDTWSKCE